MGHIVLKKADIVFRRGTSTISQGIEVVTHSKFSHAALVDDPDENLLIDVVLRGVVGDIQEFISISAILKM